MAAKPAVHPERSRGVVEVFVLSPTPFEQGQPVQGFSGLTLDADGGLLTVTDNGYGRLDNSAGFHPGVYALELAEGRLRPTLRFGLQNPHGRPLTGAEIDPESLVRAPDGTFWVGEEFGPSLCSPAGASPSSPTTTTPSAARATPTAACPTRPSSSS